MWMVPARLLCSRHLTGEHSELHMLVGAIKRGKSLKGYIENGLIEIHNIGKRHTKLANEMKRRGMNHKSPLPKFRSCKAGEVDAVKSLEDLSKRCEKCRRRINGSK